MLKLLEFKPIFEEIKNSTSRKRRVAGNGFANKAGCYIIKENDLIVYIGMSKSCVVEALYRHFYEWDKYHTTYPQSSEYSALIIVTSNRQAARLEQSLIISLEPRDNKELYNKLIENAIRSKGYVLPEEIKNPTIHLKNSEDDQYDF